MLSDEKEISLVPIERTKSLFRVDPNIKGIDLETFTKDDVKIYALGYKPVLEPVMFYINKDNYDSNALILRFL